MPKIYEYFGLIFYFYSNEHAPIHIHVSSGDCETIFEIIFENGKLTQLKKRKKRGVDHLTTSDQAKAERLIESKAGEIIQKWMDYFILNKAIKCTKLTKKI